MIHANWMLLQAAVMKNKMGLTTIFHLEAWELEGGE